MIRIMLVVSITLLLSACSSIGVAYKQPVDSEDAAELSGESLYVHSFSENGCYSGRTHIEDKIRLHANTEAVVVYSAYAGEDNYFKTKYYCTIIFSFVPEKDAKYQFLSEPSETRNNYREFKPGNVRCDGSLTKDDGNGNKSPVEVRLLKSKSSGFACIRMVPKS